MVFRISVALLAILVLAGVLAPEAFGTFSAHVQAMTLSGAGWLYLVIVFGVLAFLAYVAFGRLGTLRIGGAEAEPEFSRASWFAMLFSAGMGIGLVFWGAAEPLSHFQRPPEGLPPESNEAARAAMRYVFFHWGLHPWAIYALMGLALAWFQFNRQARGKVSDLLTPLIGRHVHGPLGQLIDVLAVVATAIGVATTLGFGATQITAGLGHVTPIAPTLATQLVVIAVAFVLYMASSATGLQRGIKWLSNLNLCIAALLLALVIVLGPTAFIFETLTTSLGDYLNFLPAMSLRMTPFSQRAWVGDWTIFYWAWWIAWAPFVGSFFARISFGRTVREFILGVVFAPALVSFVWFAGFGGTVLHAEMFDHADLLSALARGYENVLFAMTDLLPFSTVLVWTAVLLLMSFFVTSADSATLVLASMSSDSSDDPPLSRRVVWGVLQAAIAVALLVAGGLEALQAVVIVAALPFALLMALVMVSLYRVLSADLLAWDIEARELYRAEKRWLDREKQAGNEAP
ncbi:BCCT family transporter [Lysobacter sp. SG-8]|uniref:BCCT family transporter n=1 Tax=Marilutibacter penaei TaxID=2759900 RepID=A0A7W3U665_9GAMM|nr:BCCT family transporter [Lysobacter penaei]MBB1089617.1 BCCT family transporter [Lysobacter penaei]